MSRGGTTYVICSPARQSWRRTLVLLASLIVAAARATALAEVTIDDFSSAVTTIEPPGITQAVVGSTTVSDGPGLSGVIGGVRRLTVTATSLKVLDSVTAGVAPLATVLDYNSSAAANGKIQLDYDAGGTGLTANLSAAAGIRLLVIGTDTSSLPCPTILTIVDAAGHSASLARSRQPTHKRSTSHLPASPEWTSPTSSACSW